MCDTLVVVRPDRILFGKSSDRDPNEAQLLDWQPRRRHAPGARVRATWIAIPEAGETFAVLLSRPFWMWGAEIGVNEHGVVIGNEAVFTREPVSRVGLTGMDLVRLALERARTADEAASVISSLIETYGQGGGCGHENRRFTYHNSFLLADPRGAIVLETAGRELAESRVEAGVRSISNGLTIPGFASKHSDRVKTRVSQSRERRARTEELGAAATGPLCVMRLLRDHGPGRSAPAYSWVNGAMGCPCMHGGGLLASSQTTASFVAELREDGVRCWATATAAPCTSLFKPVRVDTPVDLGPPATDRFDPEALFWRHELLHRRVMAAPAQLLPLFASERDALERRWVESPPEPQDAFSEASRLLDTWTERVDDTPHEDGRPLWVRRYWRKRAEMARIPTS